MKLPIVEPDNRHPLHPLIRLYIYTSHANTLLFQPPLPTPYQKNMADKALASLSRFAGLAGLGLAGAQTCLYNVDAGHRAVLFDNARGGIQDDVKHEGTHFMIPFIQSPRIMEVRVRPKELPSITGTKDLQTVQIKLRVLWRPEIDKLPDIYRKFQDQIEDRVLPSIGNEVRRELCNSSACLGNS